MESQIAIEKLVALGLTEYKAKSLLQFAAVCCSLLRMRTLVCKKRIMKVIVEFSGPIWHC